MRKLLLIVALFASLCSGTFADPKEKALQGVDKWTKGRTTIVLAKRDSGWQIVHFHRSAMPNQQ